MTSLDAGLRTLIADIVREELAKRTEATKPDEFLSTASAATVADVHQGTIRRWVKEGKLKAGLACGKLRIRRADLETLICHGSVDARQLTPEQLADRDFA